MKFSDNNSISEVFKSQAPTLSGIKKSVGEAPFKAMIAKVINGFVDSFNVGKNMSGPQVIEVVEMISREYGYLKPQDLKICFDRAKKGDYGKVFDRIDINIIGGWLGIYDLERENEIEAIRTRESGEHKQEAKHMPDVVLNAWKEALNGIEKKEQKAKEEKAKQRPKTEAELLVQKWMRQFDLIFEKQDGEKRGMRFIKRFGKMMDLNEWLTHKLEQYNKPELQKKINQLNPLKHT